MTLLEEIRQARWFSGKSRALVGHRIVDRVCWVDDAELILVELEYAQGASETYVVAQRLEDPTVARLLLDRFGEPSSFSATERGGRLEFRPTHLFGDVTRQRTEPVAVMRGEQSNTSIRFGEALILKLFRRVQFGPNPDVEVGRFLTEHSRFRGVPAVVGSVDYVSPEGQNASLAVLQVFERNRGDAWTTTLRRLTTVLNGADPRDSLAAIGRLGRTTAELHLALAAGSGEFAAQPITADDTLAWQRAIQAELSTAVEAVAVRGIAVDASPLCQTAAGVQALCGAEKIRHHGDYHLGQVLERDDGSFAIIDFEGEPAKPLALRREKRSPLRDVAGLLRSLDYARHAALRLDETTDPQRVRSATNWYDAAREAFLTSYLDAVRVGRPGLMPAEVEPPLAAMELEKAAYEVLYELNYRPDWLPIPLAALRR